MEIRSLDRAHLTRENSVDAERLVPWSALNAPFEGAWCVLRAGDASTAHAHPEYEMFIAMTGDATLEVDGARCEFVAGDIAYLVPGSTHRLINENNADFEYYGIWWDADMSADRPVEGAAQRPAA